MDRRAAHIEKDRNDQAVTIVLSDFLIGVPGAAARRRKCNLAAALADSWALSAAATPLCDDWSSALSKDFIELCKSAK